MQKKNRLYTSNKNAEKGEEMKIRELSVVVCACNPRTWEAKARGLLLAPQWIQNQSGLLETLPQKQPTKQTSKKEKMLNF